jgi:hypothetical protein
MCWAMGLILSILSTPHQKKKKAQRDGNEGLKNDLKDGNH